MAIPEQIRKQSEAVTRFYEGLNAETEAPAAGEAVSEATSDEAPVADSATSVAPDPTPDEQRRTEPTPDTAEQRYRTLQGMYNADTARLRTENQQLSARLSQLEQLLASMSAQPALQQQQTTQYEKLITDKDVEEYGDSIDVMRRVSREETLAAQRKIAELEQLVRNMQTSVLPRVEQVAQRQAVTAEQSFWSDLTNVVPNWREVNSDPGFHSWLLEIDPLTGLSRQTYLDDAQRNLDVSRVASFFRTWQGVGGQSIAQSPRNAAASQLEKQVAPGRGRSNGAPTPEQPKTYTNADIAKFFDDVRKGAFKGREAERDRIERDIFAAQRENRIVVNA
jgi:hypothetical protein